MGSEPGTACVRVGRGALTVGGGTGVDLLLLRLQRRAVTLGHPQPVPRQYKQNEKFQQNARVCCGSGRLAVCFECAD